MAEGLEDFLAVGVVLTRAFVTCPGALPWRSEAALADLASAIGRRPDASQTRSSRSPGRSEPARARRGEASRRRRGRRRSWRVALREAVDDLECGGAGWNERALADLGALLRRRNRRTEARALLREALDTAHRSGAGPFAEYAGTELRATGARLRRVLLTGLESLTASERRVAEFASEGLTNREIAQTLFITARTVEGHLTSVFRKLRLDSRDQLAAQLAANVTVPV